MRLLGLRDVWRRIDGQSLVHYLKPIVMGQESPARKRLWLRSGYCADRSEKRFLT